MGTALSNRELFVLGMVVDTPSHGHYINQVVEVSRSGRWLHMSEKHVYYVLRKLEKSGLVSIENEKPPGAPTRKVYSATAEGRLLFAEELVCPERLEAWDEEGFTVVFSFLQGATWMPDAERTRLVRRRRDSLASLQQQEYTAEIGEIVRTYFGETITWMWERDRALLEAKLAWLDRLIGRVEERGWDLTPPMRPQE